MNNQTKTLRESIKSSTDLAKIWFESKTTAKDRETFEAKGKLGDTNEGSVYVYYEQNGSALYVGQTSNGIKTRLHHQTSAHKTKLWWTNWTTMRFVQLPDETDRLVLELMLILAYSPRYNIKPKAKNLDTLFSE
ncbi:MAG: GIY-YIG nuclease family protein [Methylovulum sp.]|nr:GIY-YIG nuclease family protein [Methylovulum sp.]